MSATDTIFALSSGAGKAAVAVVRLSGSKCSSVLEGMAGLLPAARHLALRRLADPATGEILDKALIVWWPGPHSFTGEDCAELHLHGSPAVVAAVLQVLSQMPGVRPADPGEFTLRSFLNGKMDLVEVEGLGDLLDARTAGQRRQAFRQMSGEASSAFQSWREQLLMIRASIEAVVDFADEPGVADAASGEIDGRIRALLAEITEAVDRSVVSEVVRDGVRIVLAGLPNTGKSSILNALARRDAAIVSDVPGTTRDAIEVMLDVAGIPVILTDTAGLRAEITDQVEEEGVRRSYQHITRADLVLWVWSPDVSGSQVVDPSVQPDLVLRNKADLLVEVERGKHSGRADVVLSTRSGDGISELLTILATELKDRFGYAESCLLVSNRQKMVTQRLIRILNDSLDIPPSDFELKAEEIRMASDEVARLTGKVGVEEWLGAIFSRFCIGK